jgi:hypothetical protein
MQKSQQVPGGPFMHIHDAMVNIVGNDLKRAQITNKEA